MGPCIRQAWLSFNSRIPHLWEALNTRRKLVHYNRPLRLGHCTRRKLVYGIQYAQLPRRRSLAFAVAASLSLLYPCTRGWWVRPSSLTGGYRSNRLYLGVIDIARATKPARGKCKGNDVPSPKRHGGTHAHDVSVILNRITNKNSWCEFHFTSHDTQKLIDLIKLKGQKRFKLSSCTKI
jgi:hypothetical protein